MNERLILFAISLMFFNFSFSQEKNNVRSNIITERIRVDSVINVKISRIEKKLKEERKKLNEFNTDLVRYENTFWKDYTNWVMLILGALLALVPLSIAFIEYYKSNTKKKFRALSDELLLAKKNIEDFNQFQTYQELYFEDVIKPTINAITDILFELCDDKKVEISLIAEITEKYYDYERVINLTHCNLEIRKAAIEYIINRKSNYSKIKLESLLDNNKMSSHNTNLKLLIHDLLKKHENY